MTGADEPRIRSTAAWLLSPFNSAPDVVRLAVLLYMRFPLSLRNVEDPLFERAIDICHETVRTWWNRFGRCSPDRTRALEELHPASTGSGQDRHVRELRLLERRISIINAALFLAVSSTVMTTVVALLFIAELAKLHIGSRLRSALF